MTSAELEEPHNPAPVLDSGSSPEEDAHNARHAQWSWCETRRHIHIRSRCIIHIILYIILEGYTNRVWLMGCGS